MMEPQLKSNTTTFKLNSNDLPANVHPSTNPNVTESTRSQNTTTFPNETIKYNTDTSIPASIDESDKLTSFEKYSTIKKVNVNIQQPTLTQQIFEQAQKISNEQDSSNYCSAENPQCQLDYSNEIHNDIQKSKHLQNHISLNSNSTAECNDFNNLSTLMHHITDEGDERSPFINKNNVYEVFKGESMNHNFYESIPKNQQIEGEIIIEQNGSENINNHCQQNILEELGELTPFPLSIGKTLEVSNSPQDINVVKTEDSMLSSDHDFFSKTDKIYKSEVLTDDVKSNVNNNTQESQYNNNISCEVDRHKCFENEGNDKILSGEVKLLVTEINNFSDEIRQVKIFFNDGKSAAWMEIGLGIFSVKTDNYQDIFFNITTTKNLNAVMLKTKLDNNTRYAMQGRTLITWMDEDLPKCLSFASELVCFRAWAILQIVVPDRIYDKEDNQDDGYIQYQSNNDESLDSQNDATQTNSLQALNSSFMQNDSSLISPNFNKFPLVTNTETLLECLEILRAFDKRGMKPYETFQTITKVTDGNWLDNLWKLLYEHIEKNDENVCGQIAEVLCRLIGMYTAFSNPFFSAVVNTDEAKTLNMDEPILRILSDKHYEHFFKALEYEPELRKHGIGIKHVDFLKHSSQFRELICTSNPMFRATCHIIYRILYLRDVCLPRHLDEMTIQRLNGLIQCGYAYLCRIMQYTPGCFSTLQKLIPVDIAGAKFLLQLLSILRSSHATTCEKPKLYLAIKNEHVLETLEGYFTETCEAAIEHRKFMWRCLRRRIEDENRLSSIIKSDIHRQHRPYFLSYDRMSIQTLPEIAIEILHYVVEYDPSLLRNILLNQASCTEGPPSYWVALCRVFRACDNEGVYTQLADIFRRILDPTLMESPECDGFLSIFYDRGILDILMDIILTPSPVSFEDLLPTTSADSTPYFISDIIQLSNTSDVEDEENDLQGYCDEEEYFDTKVHEHTEDKSFHNRLDESALHQENSEYSDQSAYPKFDYDIMVNRRISMPVRRQSEDLLCPPPAKRRASSGEVIKSILPNNNINISPLIPQQATSWSPKSNTMPNTNYYKSKVNKSNSFFDPESSIYFRRRSSSLDDDLICTRSNYSASKNLSEKPKSRNMPSALLKKIKLLESLSNAEKEQLLATARAQLSFVKCQISDILAFCVMKHNCRIKYRTLQQNIHLQLLKMSFEPIFDPFLAIYAVKFLKSCLLAQADYYARIFVRHDIFSSLLFLLRHRVIPPKNRSEGSLLESVIFEFLTTVRMLVLTSPSVATLLQTLFEKHGDDVEFLDNYYSSHCNYILFKELRSEYNDIVQQRSTKNSRRDYWTGFLTEDDYSEEEMQSSGNSLKTKHRLKNSLRRQPSTFMPENELEDLIDDELDVENQSMHTYLRSKNHELSSLDNESSEDSRESINILRSLEGSPNPFNSLDMPIPYSTDMNEDDSDVPDFLKPPPTSTEKSSSEQKSDEKLKPNTPENRFQRTSSPKHVFKFKVYFSDDNSTNT